MSLYSISDRLGGGGMSHIVFAMYAGYLVVIFPPIVAIELSEKFVAGDTLAVDLVPFFFLASRAALRFPRRYTPQVHIEVPLILRFHNT